MMGKANWLAVCVTMIVLTIAPPSRAQFAAPAGPVVISAGPVESTPADAPADRAAAASASVSPASTATSQPASTVELSEIERRPLGGGSRSLSAEEGKAPGATAPSWTATWWAMVVVIGLIAAAAWAVKRWAPGMVANRPGGPFRVLSRSHLSARQYVTLVQVGRKLLLLGVTGQQITLLAEVADPDEVQTLLASCPAGRSILRDGFGQLLGRQQAEMADECGEPDESAGQALSQLGQLVGQIKSRLSKLKSGDRP